MPPRLDDLIDELREADRQERIELLIDLAKQLPPLPERLEAHKDAHHRVEECQSPVYLFVERDGPELRLYADVPVESPTVRGFVAMLLDGLAGASADDVLSLPDDLVERAGMTEILGMLRVRGLHGVVRRLKGMTARLLASESLTAPVSS